MTGSRPLSWKKKIQYGLETALAYALYGFFGLLPLEAASNVGGAIMRRVGPHLKLHKRAEDNLLHAFPEKTDQERGRIIDGMWDNLGRVVAEYPHLHAIWKNVAFGGVNHFARARDEGAPAIFFGGHLANWEISAIGAKQSGLPIHLVYRRPNNPWVNPLLLHARNSAAVGHIPKGREGAREILSVLKKGGVVGMLMDQKLNEGISVPFFGREAMTAEAIAHFALKLGCKLYPARIERTHGAHFRLTTFPALRIEPTGDKKADVYKIMLEINGLLESWIRDRPEQWLWIHRRWPDNGLKS